MDVKLELYSAAVEGIDGAIERAVAYVEAGADMIFPEAMKTLDDYRRFKAAVKVPILANLTEFGSTPFFTTDELRDAEQTFPAEWIAEAMRIAVARNARNWRYVRAVLERWQKEGKDDGPGAGPAAPRGDSEASRKRFVSGKYADIIES